MTSQVNGITKAHCFRCKNTENLIKGYYEAGFEESNSEFSRETSPRETDSKGEIIFFEWFCPEHSDEVGEF